MTGQGDKNYAAIKNARQADKALDVSKQFTSNGCRVRNLSVHKVNYSVVGGKKVTTASYRNVIRGQVYTQNQWLDAEWDCNGKHPQTQWNLVQKREENTQANLF